MSPCSHNSAGPFAGSSPQARYAQELVGQRVLVVGAARSGIAVARLLLGLGARVTLADRSPATLAAAGVRALEPHGLRVVDGDGPALLGGHDLLVISPGIPVGHPLVRAATGSGTPVTGELELAARLARAPLVCLTGTNGKSTTVELIGALLAASGRNAPVVGNVGRPLADHVLASGPSDVLVVEVSSFQLETALELAPRVAVLLNVAADHLDRHGDLATYVRTKLRLFARQSGGDDSVLPADWNGPSPPGGARRLQFGVDPARVDEGTTLIGGTVVRRSGGREERVIGAGEVALRGPHNLLNVLAAVTAIERFEVDGDAVAGVLRRFQSLPHRLQRVAKIDGVLFLNDSKATNVHAMRSALMSFPGGVHLLAGGRDKGDDYESVARLIRERVVRVYRFGEARGRLAQAWRGVDGESFETLADAFAAAARQAVSGEVVLLSPGCASFDQFENFEERGDVFRALVFELAKRHSGGGAAPGAAALDCAHSEQEDGR